jgi:hypothetical protein
MAVLNVRYNISEEEALKLCSNVYTRTGSALKKQFRWLENFQASERNRLGH